MLIMVPMVEWNYKLHVCGVGVSYSQTRVHLLFVASSQDSGGQYYDQD